MGRAAKEVGSYNACGALGQQQPPRSNSSDESESLAWTTGDKGGRVAWPCSFLARCEAPPCPGPALGA